MTIFKFNPQYVDDRLFLKIDLNEPKQKRILSPHHQEFLNLIHENSEPKKKEVVYSEEIIEYTNSLTTWVFDQMRRKKIFF